MESSLAELMSKITSILQSVAGLTVVLIMMSVVVAALVVVVCCYSRQCEFARLAAEQEIMALKQTVKQLLNDKIQLVDENGALHENICESQKREVEESEKIKEIKELLRRNMQERLTLQKIVAWCFGKVDTQEENVQQAQCRLDQYKTTNTVLKGEIKKMGEKIEQVKQRSLSQRANLEEIITLQNKLVKELTVALCQERDLKEDARKSNKETARKMEELKRKANEKDIELSVVRELARDTSNSLKSLLIGEKVSHLEAVKTKQELQEKLEKAGKDVELYRKMYKEVQVEIERTEKHWWERFSDVEEKAHHNWLLYRQEKKNLTMMESQLLHGPMYARQCQEPRHFPSGQRFQSSPHDHEFAPQGQRVPTPTPKEEKASRQGSPVPRQTSPLQQRGTAPTRQPRDSSPASHVQSATRSQIPTPPPAPEV